MSHTIENAYDAYWFLYYHPKLNAPCRMEVNAEECEKRKKQGYETSQDVGGKCYYYYRHMVERALDRLDIFYTKTDGEKINEDKKKNIHVECWLEFGPLAWGYAYSQTDKPAGDYDTETMLMEFHDVDLDCGGPTFDEALVKLANLVLEKFGDYDKEKTPELKKCRGLCPECRRVAKW